MRPNSVQKLIAVCLLLFLGGLILLALPTPDLASVTRDRLNENAPQVVREKFLLKQEEKIARQGLERYDQPAEAQAFYASQRVPVGETAIPVEKYLLALEKMEQMPQYSTKLGQALPSRAEMAQEGRASQAIDLWEGLGPGNIGGRTRALIVHPTTPSTMYAAGVAGGVWKSTDSGGNWAPLDDLMPNLAVNSMAMDPADSDTLYAGTGEGYFNNDAVRGNGIFKTTDAGATWTQLANTANNSDFYYVNDIYVSPNDSQRLYAATRTGVWRSTDSGTNWTQVLTTMDPGGCTDMAIRSDQNPDHLLVSCGGLVQAVVYRSTDGGDNWSPVLTETNMSRTTFAIAPSNQDTIYALASSFDSSSDYYLGLHAVFRSTDGGATWTAQVRNTDATKLNTVLLTNTIVAFLTECGFGTSQFINQGPYDNVIAVDPADENRVWAGGIDLFRSDDGGQNWGLASHWWAEPTFPEYAHADQHAIVFHPDYNGTTNKTMFVGNDGGLFRTDDALANTATGDTAPCDPTNGDLVWTSVNNSYGVTQFYHGLPYPDGSTYFGGAQDNGTLRATDAAGVNGWNQIFGSDGGYVAIDPTNTNILFIETTYLGFRKSTDGGATFASAVTGISEATDNFLFITPFIMDPSNPQILWIAGKTMWRTTDQAENWTQASAPLSGGGGKSVSAIAVAPTDSDYVLAGIGSLNFFIPLSNDGFIFRTQNGTTSDETTVWDSTQPTSGVVSWLTFDPKDKNIAYATYSTFGVDHVWKSTDAGATWTAIDRRDEANGIPDIPAHTIVVDPRDSNRLFVGTDLGVFVTTDGGTTWAVENSGFANVVTEAMSSIHVNDKDILYAFTHGRGVYRVTINEPELSISKSVTPTMAAPGDAITYTIVVSNSGAITATNVVLTDTLPTYVNGTNLDTTAIVTSSQSMTLTINATVATDAAVGEVITNTGFYSHTSSTGSDSATFTVANVYGVDLSPSQTDSGMVGGMVTYTLALTNTGNTTDTFDLTVDSNWTTTLSESSLTLPAGESSTVMAQVEIPSDATDGESDTATVTATSQSSGEASALVTLTTTAMPVTSISLATFGQEANLAWQPIALLALLLALIASYRIALLQKRRLR